MALPFELSADATVTVEKIGKETLPVLVIDNAVSNPEAFIELAHQQTFSDPGGLFPGVRATLDSVFRDSLLETLEPLIESTFALKSDRWTVESDFSLVSKQTEELHPLQCIPHYDTPRWARLAVLHYLCPKSYGGTAFYRHRRTGFESIAPERIDTYLNALDSDVAIHGVPRQCYINGDTALFQEIHRFEPVFNRILVYSGNNLHSGVIDNSFIPDANVKTGRLTINSFVEPDNTSETDN